MYATIFVLSWSLYYVEDGYPWECSNALDYMRAPNIQVAHS